VEIELTSKSTYKVLWSGGPLCLNLVPLNCAAGSVGYATVEPASVLSNSLGDQVGIVELSLKNCPTVPRILWDNREHHFWEGFEGGFEPRNVVVNAPTVELTNSKTAVKASFYYIANYVKTTVQWLFKDSSGKPVWDTAITVENLTGRTLRNYLHFFACYHPSAPNYFWSSTGEIAPCAPRAFIGVANSEQEKRLRASPYTQLGDRYRGDCEMEYYRYHQPMLVSQPQTWYAGYRHVLMVEPDKCAAIVTWNNQARDYMIRPPNYDLQPGESFITTIRHAITDFQDPQALWADFTRTISKS